MRKRGKYYPGRIIVLAGLILILTCAVSCTREPTEESSPITEITSQEATESPALTEEDLSGYAPLSLISSRYTVKSLRARYPIPSPSPPTPRQSPRGLNC